MEPAADLAAQLNHLDGRDEYLRAASELLLRLFPSDHAAWNDVDARTRYSDVRVYPELTGVDIPKMLLDLFAVHPAVISFRREPSDGLRRLSDLVSDSQLYQTRAFREGLSRLEVNRQLIFLTSDLSPYRFTGWSMNRWPNDFSDAEVELARRIQPVLRLLEQA
ncbi:hypothetical protein [Sinomonas gamaensis]|uniref:hypothetical protein n=1 Tax=Sinomonas gamaensis TaxID=2565624 RepID=UPI001109E4EE|nr:hypothetical protein [Sinomonas gamaensis]